MFTQIAFSPPASTGDSLVDATVFLTSVREFTLQSEDRLRDMGIHPQGAMTIGLPSQAVDLLILQLETAAIERAAFRSQMARATRDRLVAAACLTAATVILLVAVAVRL